MTAKGATPTISCFPEISFTYVWCFDLLAMERADLRGLALEHRREKLSDVIIEADSEMLGFSDGFSDPIPLLARCEQMKFEGVVSKRRTSPYRSGPQTDWVKVTCSGWKSANVDRAQKMAIH
jgi:ATP-dependent DNA ligase